MEIVSSLLPPENVTFPPQLASAHHVTLALGMAPDPIALPRLPAAPPRPMEPTSPPDDDAALARAAAAGNHPAFADLVARHQRRIFTMAARYARNHHELEDLAQDIFLRAWRGLPSYQATAPFSHWLAKVAIRTCFDFLRRHRLRRQCEVSRDALLLDGSLPPETPPSPAAASDNAALLRVRSALARLHPKDQLIISLIELDDRPVKEVASLTGWSESNVKVRAFRARARLRSILESMPHGD